MKKYLSALLCFLTVLGSLSVAARAAEEPMYARNCSRVSYQDSTGEYRIDEKQIADQKKDALNVSVETQSYLRFCDASGKTLFFNGLSYYENGVCSDAVTATKITDADDPQSIAWRLTPQRETKGILRGQTADGAVYTFPVEVTAPKLGFRDGAGNYLPFDSNMLPTAHLTGTAGEKLAFSFSWTNGVGAVDVWANADCTLTGISVSKEGGSEAVQLLQQGEAKSAQPFGFTCTVDAAGRQLRFEGMMPEQEKSYELHLSWKTVMTDSEGKQFESFGRMVRCIRLEPVAPEGIPFLDISESAYYCDAVRWAYDKRITTGTSAVSFGPKQSCTRGQVVTFLWRALGEPKPQSTELRFTDVAEDAYYAKAVLWATENGITSGTGAGRFSPEQTCSNAHILTFLWRAVGSPEQGLSGGEWYDSALCWAKNSGLLEGTYEGELNVNDVCIRANVVEYLYRNSQNA